MLSAINLFTLTFFSSSNVYADTSSSITISISGNVSLDLMPTDTTGTFAKSSEQTITVTSNHYSGYTLSIVGQDNTRQLKSTIEGSSNSLTSITSNISESTFSSSSNITYNSKWGFLPSKLNSAANTNYILGPTTTATILDNNTTIPNETGTSTNYTLAIGARANTETPKEPYAGKFTIAAVGNAPKYTINYYSTTGTPTNMPTTTSGYMSGRSINIASNTPERADNYEFLGWCTTSTNNENCSGQTLQPSDSYSFTNVNYKTNNVLNLYAIWEKPILYMQDVLDWEDQIPNTGDQMQVKDKRDNKVYWVGRQADGNIWMTQNLDFEITSDILTSELTDLTAYGDGTGYTSAAGYTQENGVIKWTPASTAITSGRTVPISTSTGNVSGLTNWTNDNYTPYSAEGGDVYVYTSGSNSDDTVYTSLSSCITASHTEAECKHYHRGNYYNWSAAIANNSTNVTELTTNYNTAQNSICPAGWRLPIGAKAGTFSQTNTEFAYLLKQSNIFANYPTTFTNSVSYATNGFINIRSNPLYFVRMGSARSSTLFNSGTYVTYWSSSAYSTTGAYALSFSSTNVSPAPSNNRYNGIGVRCVARPVLYMQDVADWKNQIPNTGDSVRAKDRRDGKVYWVARLADGNIWMAQNLDFDITGEPLTSETSDLITYNTGGYTSAAGYTEENGVIKWTPVSTAITSNASAPISINTGTVSGVTGWTDNSYNPYSTEGGDVYVYTSNTTDPDTIYTSLSSCIAASHTEAECKHYHRGNYYNWSAAVASNDTNVTELNTQYNTAQNSICPAGWRLPVGAKGDSFSRTNTEFAYLLKESDIIVRYPYSMGNYSSGYTANGFYNIRSNPIFFTRSGYISSGSVYNFGIIGYYWSSSVGDYNKTYGLDFFSGSVSTVFNTERYYGYNIRCMVRESYMQDVAKWESKIPNTGDEMTVVDKRDGKEYTVARQADGKIWMTQNLDFEITGETLTSDTTDLTAYGDGTGYTGTAGYTQENGIIKWIPASTAITCERIVPVSTDVGIGTANSGMTGWINNQYVPYSAEGGDVYVYTSNNSSTSYTNVDTIYTSLSSCIAVSHTEAECKHYHRGNYYNWSASVASNNTNVTELNTQYNTAQNSICPAGWKLPIAAKTNSFSQTNTEFAYLLKQSKIFTNYPTSIMGSTMYATNALNNVRSNPLFFVRSGFVYDSSLQNSGLAAYYWSSSVRDSTNAHILQLTYTNIYPANQMEHYYGLSVRCVAR